MNILTTFIETVGLNQSFFFHLFWAGFLYFVSKKWLFEPYIASMNQRERATKGRVESSKKLELEIQKNQELYEQKAKSTHKRFQDIFQESKQKTESWFLEQSLKAQSQQKAQLKERRLQIQQKAQEQKEILNQALPELSESLLKKIKS